MDCQIPIILCIDVEPDGFFIERDRPLPWKGYERAFEYFSKLRQLSAAISESPTHFSWFYRMDPQVAETYGTPDWAIKNYPTYVEDFLKKGDEMGLHPHAYRWVKTDNDWLVDHADQEWVDHCVEMSFAAYKNVFGRTCDSFRFGASWINDATLRLVEKLGARFDLTLEPEYVNDWSYEGYRRYRGSYLDYECVPRMPYRPSHDDLRRPDPERKEGIWMIPTSTGKITYRYGRTERLLRRIFKPSDLKPRRITLNLAYGPNRFRIITEELLRCLERPYFAFVMRTDALSSPQQMKNVEACFDILLNHPRARQFVFSTPAEALRILGCLEPAKALAAL